jgi:alkylation response protein AidB-like acyl-CoA dehydrogenase
MPLFEASKELRDFRQVFKKFVAREVTPHFEEWEKNRGVPRELWKKMGKQGFLAPWLPEEYGGSNLDFRYSVVIGEELVRGVVLPWVCLSVVMWQPLHIFLWQRGIEEANTAQGHHWRCHLRSGLYGTKCWIGSCRDSNKGRPRWRSFYYQWTKDIHYKRHLC